MNDKMSFNLSDFRVTKEVTSNGHLPKIKGHHRRNDKSTNKKISELSRRNRNSHKPETDEIETFSKHPPNLR